MESVETTGSWRPIPAEALRRTPWRVQVAHRVHLSRAGGSGVRLFYREGQGWLLWCAAAGLWLAFSPGGRLTAVSVEGELGFRPPGERDWF